MTISSELLVDLKCPACDFIGKNITSLGTHAAMKHKISGEQLFLIRAKLDKPPTCQCGCGGTVRYVSLTIGYNRFIQNHGNDEFYKARGKKIAKALADNPDSQASKHSDKFKKKVSQGRKKGFADGTILNWSDKRINPDAIIWNKGLTTKTDERIAVYGKKCSEILKKKFADGSARIWSTLSIPEVMSRIQEKNEYEFIDDVSKYESSEKTKFLFRHKKCGHEQKMSLLQLQQGMLCVFCEHGKVSKGQKEVYSFIKSLTPNVILNDRSAINPYELDIWVEDNRFAVEYNWLYYHSDAREDFDKNAHANKQSKCQLSNISLFQIFEDEWKNKQEIIKSMLKHRLGCSSKKIFARKTEVIEFSYDKRVNEFLKASHIEGVGGRYDKAFALRYDGDIVACLTLRKPFSTSHKGFYEIARFATSLDTAVIGGLSKLTSIASFWAKKQGAIGLMTYLDQRFGAKLTYQKCGFEFLRETPPRFWWTSFSQLRRFARQKFKAMNGKSEKQVADEAGVFRVYGCKNSVFILKFEKANEN